MKKIYSLLLLFIALNQGAMAQQFINFGPLHSPDSPREDWVLPGDTVYQEGKPMIYKGKPFKNNFMVRDKAGRNTKTSNAAIASASYSENNKEVNNGDLAISNNGMENFASSWGLHQGLNFSVDLSAFATFGKHVPHRGGFSQVINATYLTPLTKDNKLWVALGGYVTNTNYGSDNYHDGGLYGIMGYKFNEHWEAYVYGQFSVAGNYNSLYGGYGYGRYGAYGYGAPWGYGMYPWGYGILGRGLGYGVMPGGYGMGAPGANVLGAGLRYTNKNFSIGINIEGVWYDNHTPSYYKQYDYPVPEAPGK